MPTWYQKLDLEVLDLSSCQFCVCGQLAKHSAPARRIIQTKDELGQLYGAEGGWNFHAMTEALAARFADFGSSNYSDYGFDTPWQLDEAEGDTEAAYEVLGGMWVREVRARQRAQVAV